MRPIIDRPCLSEKQDRIINKMQYKALYFERWMKLQRGGMQIPKSECLLSLNAQIYELWGSFSDGV